MKNLRKSMVQTKDEENIGEIKDFYFDDHEWIIRYLVIDTGSWLSEKLVLVSPHAIDEIGIGGFVIKTNLTRYQIEHSPSAETHKPLDRLMEEKYARYYGWPLYWTIGNDIWPVSVPQTPIDKITEKQLNRKIRESNLRSFNDVRRYSIHARDEQFGHVEDMAFEEDSFKISYLIVDTVNFWPSKSVLIAPDKITKIEWVDREFKTVLTRDEIEAAREYNPYDFIDRAAKEGEKREHRTTL